MSLRGPRDDRSELYYADERKAYSLYDKYASTRETLPISRIMPEYDYAYVSR